MKTLLRIFLVLSMVIASSCSSNDNEIELSLPELLTVLSPEEAYIYLYDREIDHSKTSSCGIATPASSTSSTTTTTSSSARQTTGSTTSNTQFTIFSRLVMKYTEETLILKYTYNMNQYQGNIDSQQGFVLTGELYQRTITGTSGLVKWSNSSIGYINTGISGEQTLSFFDIEINLTGTYADESSSSTTDPFLCPTLDNTTCEYGQATNGKTCYTTDNVSCVVNSSTGSTVSIIGKLKCNAENVVPN